MTDQGSHKARIKVTGRDIEIGFDFIVVSALLVFAAIWAVGQFYESPPYVSEERYPIRGIDVSAHNDMMNLDAAHAAGMEFIFIKASEGVTFHDENFRINYDKAYHAGMKIGAYHFFRFDKDGVDQGINFLKAIGNRELDLGVAIDVEKAGNPANVPTALIIKRLEAMIDYLQLSGYSVMIYTNREGYQDFLTGSLKGIPLWICSFQSTPIAADWIFWQYDHHGKVSGIKGDVDLNAFCGDRREWETFLGSIRTPTQYNATSIR